MDIDFKKLAPWNWFKKEQEEQQSTASLPVQRNDLPVAGGPVSPILQLHREIDRLFDDAFRGFGFPTLAMPRWPSDWPGMLKPALDIRRPTSSTRSPWKYPASRKKTSRSRSTTTCCWCAVKSVRSRKRKTAVSIGWSAPTAAFSAL